MRALKITGLVLGGLFALVALALVAIWLLFDPNDYKDRIAASVQKSTGRSLSLPGELKLSVFPWLAIETGAATLGNPPGFGDEPFLSLQHARLSVKLMPLLQKRLEVGRIQIDGLDLRLQQDEQGKGNWEEWGGSAEEAADDTGGTPVSMDLAGIGITDGRIALDDFVADAVEIDIGRVAPGVSVPVSMKAEVTTAPGEKALPLQASFALLPDLDNQRYQLTDLELQGRIQPDGAPKELDWNFDAPAADIDLAAQTLSKTPFTARFGDAQVLGQIEGSKLVDAPAFTGIFKLEELSPRALMSQLGMDAPVTRDAGVLSHFTAQGAFAWQDEVARLSNLALVLDDSKLSGRFDYDTRDSGMAFALNLDRIDIDRYQPPPPAEEASSDPIELPVDLLKSLRARGRFEIGEIKAGGARLTQLSADIAIADALAKFGPLKAQLYGGTYSGEVGLDMRAAVPRLTMDEHMRGIDIAALMKDYADSERLSGRGNLDMVLSARGSSGGDLLKTLDGTLAVDLQGGAVEGIDVWYAIAQAQSLISQRRLAAATNTKRTVFDTFKASAQVDAGVATTRDLLIASQLLRITGAGSTNLDTHALDFLINATVLKAPPGEGADVTALERATIPVRITGTLTDPKIRPDLAGMAKERIQQEIEQRKDEVKEQLQERRDETEQKVRDKVQDRLKDLLKKK